MSDIPTPRNGPGWVVMHHPDIPGEYAEATEDAYHGVWEPKGWLLVTDEDRARSLSGMKKADLQAEAARLGLDTSGTADELRERLTTAREAS